MTDFEEIATYENKLKPWCFLSFSRNVLGQATATVQTEQNRWPHWQQATGETLLEAWTSLKAFLDGGPQIHGNTHTSHSHFLAPVETFGPEEPASDTGGNHA